MAAPRHQRVLPAADAPDELVRSLASTLVWLDVATLSLDRPGLTSARHSLTQARLLLRVAVRRLRGPR